MTPLGYGSSGGGYSSKKNDDDNSYGTTGHRSGYQPSYQSSENTYSSGTTYSSGDTYSSGGGYGGGRQTETKYNTSSGYGGGILMAAVVVAEIVSVKARAKDVITRSIVTTMRPMVPRN